jgi:hypothetical protein
VATQTQLEPVRSEPQGSAPGEKGLKSGAISFVSNVVIGTASVAPAYSLAAALGFIVAVPGVGLSAPAVLLVSFIPMFCIAFAYNYSKPILGVQVPIVMGIGGILLGGLLMLWAWAPYRGFFRRRPEVASRDALYS